MRSDVFPREVDDRLSAQLQRDVNRLRDSNRAVRLKGLENLLRLYEGEAARRGVELPAEDDFSFSTNCGSLRASPSQGERGQDAFAQVYLNDLHSTLTALCSDQSEACRFSALRLVQLNLTCYLSDEQIWGLCSPDERPPKSLYTQNSPLPERTPFLETLCRRLSSSEDFERSEELRRAILQLLLQTLQFAKAPGGTSRATGSKKAGSGVETLRGFEASRSAGELLAAASKGLADRSGANAMAACLLAVSLSQRLAPSELLKVGASLSLLSPKVERLCSDVVRPSALRAVASFCAAIRGRLPGAASLSRQASARGSLGSCRDEALVAPSFR